MRFGSMFSGIEAASVAWEPLGWKCQWVAEIDKFPSAVLKHHYPDVPNLGDVTKVDWEKISATRPVDVIVFGSPCQSFSVAGKRLGLDDPRGNLAWLIACAPVSSSLKTSLDYLVPTKDGTLLPSSGSWGNAGISAPGGFSMPSMPEYHSAAVASSLSDILETGDVPRRFFLSAKACSGILRRAAKRGKELPPALSAALTAAATSTTPAADI